VTHHKSAPLAAAILLIAALACGQATPPPTSTPTAPPAPAQTEMQPPPTSTPTAPPAPAQTETQPSPTAAAETIPASYDGTWTGFTGEGHPITLTVEQSKIVEIEFAVSFVTPRWNATTTGTLQPDAPVAQDGSFSYHFESAEISVSFTGQFSGDTLAGEFEASKTHPQGLGTATTTVSFSAARTAMTDA
jgi:hypothetical protein